MCIRDSCWKSDEESILYYHGVNEGFKGRKLIPEYYFDKEYTI
jgi:hypothetical protein